MIDFGHDHLNFDRSIEAFFNIFIFIFFVNTQFLFFFWFSFFIIEYLSCRQVLNLMVILGFMLNYALRVNLTIAIVAMVEEPANKPTSKISLNAAAVSAAVPIKNDTFFHNLHSTEELSSAAHTLPISTTPEPFQNLTDKVSF